MTPPKYQQINQLYHAALSLPPEQRQAYLVGACAGDQKLEAEVASLLAAHEAAGDFIAVPAIEAAANLLALEDQALAQGSRISHYEIVAPLGAGGMGEVYLATDTRLGRKVAIKLLPAQFTTDTTRVSRFVQEARAASALNHPHVITIYDIGRTQARHFIVMEFVEGQTLRAQMKQGMLQAVAAVGVQIAKALAAAHDAGITHRDIKPENIMVRTDGYVKVLDFGLARLASPDRVDSQVATLAHTQPGMILGTVRYMSPEQASGEEVGVASDIFSLGIVLYEMATGHAPFAADTLLATLNAITSQYPLPPSHWQPDLPAALETLLLRMLEKDPRRRPSALDVAGVLQELGGAGVRESSSLADQTKGIIYSGSLARARSQVGREKELAELRAGFSSVAAGQSLLLCVAGEPGIGKTTLIENFLDELNTRSSSCFKARGRCSERLAGTEAYLPWLEALERLLRDHGRLETVSLGTKSIAEMMRRLTPTWYAQVAQATIDTPDTLAAIGEHAASQERLKRELYSLLCELSAQRPVVLFLDDLQWADASTVDLLAYLAGRFEGTRLLLLVSYRPTDLLQAKHLFLKLKPELQARGICRELTLEFLTQAEIEQYLSFQFSNHRFPAELAQLIYAKTEGNPLFMVDLVRYLRDRQVIAQEQGEWVLAQALPDIAHNLPESVRAMIECKISELSEEDRQLLVAASVQGYAFDAAVVAQALKLDTAEVEERLEKLERMHALVRVVKEREFLDGTLTLHLRFVHVLYQNALYASLRATRKAALSRAVAEALESLYGEQRASVANELALLWETAREFQRAVEYFHLAARNAGQFFAAREARTLAERGLATLDKLPATSARHEQELLLQIVLGHALMTVKGYAAPETERTYARARALCQQLGETPYLLPASYGLYVVHQVRAELRRTLELGEELLQIAKLQGGPELIVGYWAVGIPLLYLGELTQARVQFEQVLALYDPAQHRPLTWLYAHEPGMLGHSYLSLALWLLGFPEQALAHSRQGIALSQEIAHPHSQVFACSFAIGVSHFLHDVQQVAELAEACKVLADKEKLIYWSAISGIWCGWARVEQGQPAEGIAEMLASLETRRLTGVEIFHPHFSGVLAEAYGKAGQPGAGLAVLDEAEALPARKEERVLEAELHRLRGELLLMEEAPAAIVEPHFERALAVARQQQAKSLELRAAMSMSRLWQSQGKQAEARALLAEIYDWFTEGFETADLRAARALLDQL